MSKQLALVEPPTAEVAACRHAAARCCTVIAGFFLIDPISLMKSTRGAARESFPRQVLMSGLVSGLGFSSRTVGKAIGRDPATIEHACRVIEAFRIEPHGRKRDVDDDLIRDLGIDAVDDWFGGEDGAAEFLRNADELIDRFFSAFQLVAVMGLAYTQELDRRGGAAKARSR